MPAGFAAAISLLMPRARDFASASMPPDAPLMMPDAATRLILFSRGSFDTGRLMRPAISALHADCAAMPAERDCPLPGGFRAIFCLCQPDAVGCRDGCHVRFSSRHYVAFFLPPLITSPFADVTATVAIFSVFMTVLLLPSMDTPLSARISPYARSASFFHCIVLQTDAPHAAVSMPVFHFFLEAFFLSSSSFSSHFFFVFIELPEIFQCFRLLLFDFPAFQLRAAEHGWRRRRHEYLAKSCLSHYFCRFPVFPPAVLFRLR